MRLFIEPTEPLLFRTGRPFDAGESNFADSLFPPTPETLQGAIRATIATHWGLHKNKNLVQAFNDPELTQLIGDRNGYGRFRITGLTLGRYSKENTEDVERLLPPPAYVMRDDNGLLRLSPQPLQKNVQSNLPDGITHILLPVPGNSINGKLEPAVGWLTEKSLHEVLHHNSSLQGIQAINANDIYEQEPRLGIGIQKGTKKTQDGFLYQVQMIRMKPSYGFVVDIQLTTTSYENTPLNDERIMQLLHLPRSGWMTLGGEQRAAHFKIVTSPVENKPESAKKGTLLYLTTPAYFTGGWRPPMPTDAPIAAAINHYQAIGGWKLNAGDAKGESKTTRRCVPAGSVYFFNHAVSVTQPLTDYGMEIGYGITYTGEW